MTSKPAVTIGRIPERLSRHWRTLLVCGDVLVILFVSLVVLTGDGNKIASSLVTTGVICGIFWLCGLYKRSYAVSPRDEVYFACAGVALAAVPITVLLVPVADLSLLSVALTLVFCAVGISALHVRLHLERRGNAPAFAGISTISPGGWHDRESVSYRLGKRLFDATLACVALLLASPLMLLAALAIVLESGTPALFRQQRVGENGRPFWIFKFRTMRTDAGQAWAQPGDSRITKAGAWLRKTSLDELPQLFNVVRGEMSLVGPRPEMLSFAEDFSKSIPNYDQRHVVAPGITGWAQVYLQRNLTPADVPYVLPYDLFYVENASFVLDCVILLKTTVEVLFHRAV